MYRYIKYFKKKNFIEEVEYIMFTFKYFNLKLIKRPPRKAR